MEISGTNFGSDPATQIVRVGGTGCSIVSWTDTLIKCTLPRKSPGTYDVEIDMGDLGFAIK